MFNYGDEAMDLSASGFDGKNRELVLGRRTYEIFEAHWPYQPDDDLRPGSFANTEPSAKELARRKKMVNEMW